MPIITLARRRAPKAQQQARKRHREALQSDPFRLQPASSLVSLTPVVGRWFSLPPATSSTRAARANRPRAFVRVQDRDPQGG
jgi:hypothetical protein